MWHTGRGVIVYDPNRGEMKRRTEHWCVINVDKEITRYYRWWIARELHVKGLCMPSWDAHISVVRGEYIKPQLTHLWKKYHGQPVEFQYRHDVRCSNNTNKREQYWFVEVMCPLAKQIRDEFGMASDWNQHLTVAKIN